MKKKLFYILLYPIAYAYYKPKKALRFAGLIVLAICLCTFIGVLFSNNASEPPMEIPTYTLEYQTPYPALTATHPLGTLTLSSEPTAVVTPVVTTPTLSPKPSETEESDATAPPVSLPVIKEYDFPEFLCDSAFIYDINNDELLYINGHDDPILPASTTKLLTILYARTLLPLDLEVTPGDELSMVGPNSSTAHLATHHVLTVEQLIEAMLLPSGNDAAHVLAAAGGRAINPEVKSGQEAVGIFMEGMNEYAKKIGMTNSNFITPDGYDAEGHYSSVEDMMTVARLAYADPVIRKYCATVSETVYFSSGHKITWKNTNQCINPASQYYSPYINGLKTGTISSTYCCLLSSANIEGRDFVFGFFGETQSANRFKDALTAVAWIRKNILE